MVGCITEPINPLHTAVHVLNCRHQDGMVIHDRVTPTPLLHVHVVVNPYETGLPFLLLVVSIHVVDNGVTPLSPT